MGVSNRQITSMAHDDFIPSDDFPEEIDHEFKDNIVCPHCGFEHRDSYEWGQWNDECGEGECSECEKPFKWSREISVSYSTKKLGEE